MEDKRWRGGVRLIRRACALAMALVGLWALSLTTDFSGVTGVLRRLGEHPEFVTRVMAMGLSQEGEPQMHLAGIGRIMVGNSALLSAGLGLVERAEEEEAYGDPIMLEEHDDGSGGLVPIAPEDSQVVVHTSVGKDDGSFLSLDRLYLKNSAGLAVDLPALAAAQLAVELETEGPQILILHTHGSEAYTMSGQDVYLESDPYRTTDCNQNIVRVGEEMAQVFRSYGFEVLHDTTLYDYPLYNGAYDRSRQGAEDWLEQYPSIKIILDVHRDALVSADGIPYKLVAEEQGDRVAQVMLVVGSSDSGAEHPNWRNNLALALQLQLRLTENHAQLARPITLRSSRFNQHLSPGALLVEVGGHGNTLQEAIGGARLFAHSAAQKLAELKK